MSASIVSLRLDGGIQRFCCPVCGRPVLQPYVGMADDFCVHIVGVVDWVDELHLGESNSAELAGNIEDAHGQGADLETIASLMASSTILFEFVEPARGGGHDGSSFVVAVDMAREAEGWLALKPRVATSA